MVFVNSLHNACRRLSMHIAPDDFLYFISRALDGMLRAMYRGGAGIGVRVKPWCMPVRNCPNTTARWRLPAI
jgi:hypothetical protein